MIYYLNQMNGWEVMHIITVNEIFLIKDYFDENL